MTPHPQPCFIDFLKNSGHGLSCNPRGYCVVSGCWRRGAGVWKIPVRRSSPWSAPTDRRRHRIALFLLSQPPPPPHQHAARAIGDGFTAVLLITLCDQCDHLISNFFLYFSWPSGSWTHCRSLHPRVFFHYECTPGDFSRWHCHWPFGRWVSKGMWKVSCVLFSMFAWFASPVLNEKLSSLPL